MSLKGADLARALKAEGDPWQPTFSGKAEVRQATTYQALGVFECAQSHRVSSWFSACAASMTASPDAEQASHVIPCPRGHSLWTSQAHEHCTPAGVNPEFCATRMEMTMSSSDADSRWCVACSFSSGLRFRLRIREHVQAGKSSCCPMLPQVRRIPELSK